MDFEEKLKKSANFDKLLQGLVILVANHRVGVKITKDFHINLIYKAEGGGVVNGREIVVTKDHNVRCYDNRDYKRRYESDIVEQVIQEVLTIIDWEKETIQEQIEKFVLSEKIDLSADELFLILQLFTNNPFGDPLRNLFRGII
jgi:hypothetical protein